MRFEAKPADSGGRWHITSDDVPELKVTGRTMHEVLTKLPAAIEALRRKKDMAQLKGINNKTKHHDHLWSVCKLLPQDYQPYGEVDRNTANKETGDYAPDCSGGCMYFYKLEAKSGEKLYFDWGICGNPNSHRCGLLTFEHQGCPHGVYGYRDRKYGKNPFEAQKQEGVDDGGPGDTGTVDKETG